MSKRGFRIHDSFFLSTALDPPHGLGVRAVGLIATKFVLCYSHTISTISQPHNFCCLKATQFPLSYRHRISIVLTLN
jgi:hypothetical protein